MTQVSHLYFAGRGKTGEMIKDFKERLGSGNYQVWNLQTIQREMALCLLSYALLILLKILQQFRAQTVSLDTFVLLLAV